MKRQRHAVTITLQPGRFIVRAPMRLGDSVGLVGARNLVKRTARAAHDDVLHLLALHVSEQTLVALPADVVSGPGAFHQGSAKSSVDKNRARIRRRLRDH